MHTPTMLLSQQRIDNCLSLVPAVDISSSLLCMLLTFSRVSLMYHANCEMSFSHFMNDSNHGSYLVNCTSPIPTL